MISLTSAKLTTKLDYTNSPHSPKCTQQSELKPVEVLTESCYKFNPHPLIPGQLGHAHNRLDKYTCLRLLTTSTSSPQHEAICKIQLSQTILKSPLPPLALITIRPAYRWTVI
ncbi:unnamed protein product [Protopolystoma xenopodis]|uniref:Uncharacterized protein n=1 Tax=Protopolystoma xenopodis TaxID=117903 RepID=A0A3S5AUT1_9PLAT|nr:unnamed protein product [Protopolystoma xenopodis]